MSKPVDNHQMDVCKSYWAISSESERIKFKAQEQHMISCSMHTESTVVNYVYREVLLNTGC